MHLISPSAVDDEPVSHDPAIRKAVLLRRGTVPHVAQLARSMLAPGQATTPHAHADLHEVFVVLAGEAVVTVDGREHRLAPGGCVVIEPGERHALANAGGTELVLLYFGIEPSAPPPRGT